MSLLDSFDNNKKRCRECGEYFDITTEESKINTMIGLCGRCFKKVFSEFKKPFDKKYELNKKANLLNKYSYSNYKWFKDE
jgi:hypothetical protein